MFDRRAICLLIMKPLWKHISFAFFCRWSYGSHQLFGHSWLRSNSLLVLQHADRKFLSLTRCEPNETSYWHPRVVIWGEYVARCGNTASLVSSSFCSSIIGQCSLGPHASAPTELTDLLQAQFENLSIIKLCTFGASYFMWLLNSWN